MADIEKGKALKHFRLNVLGMGLHKFADFLGIKPSQLCNIEHGRPPNFTSALDEKPPESEFVIDQHTVEEWANRQINKCKNNSEKYIYRAILAFLDAQRQRIEALEKQNEEIARDNLKLMSSNQALKGE